MKKLFFTTLFTIFLLPVRAQISNSDVIQNLEQDNNSDRLTATLKSASRLFASEDDLTSVILIVPSGTTVDVLSIDSSFYKIVYNEKEGYIFRKHATLNELPVQPSQSSQSDVIQPSQNVTPNTVDPCQQEKQEQSIQQEQSRFSYLKNKYGTSVAARINTGKIWKGMSPEMVTDSWGNPQKINRVISGNVIKEEWIYRNTWLYFQNNTLIEWGRKK